MIISNVKEAREFIKEYKLTTLLSNRFLNELSMDIYTPEGCWKTDENPWEWKKEIVLDRECLYGKLFGKYAGFAYKDVMYDLINYRRDGYDFEARINSMPVSEVDIMAYNTIVSHKNIDTKSLRAILNVDKEHNSEFEKSLERLQMQTYICVASFDYQVDKNGNFYGWGIASYSTPELLFSERKIEKIYEKDPMESRNDLLKVLKKHTAHHSDRDYERYLYYK